MDLVRRIADSKGEFLLYALTPPRLATADDRVEAIADATLTRLRPLGLTPTPRALPRRQPRELAGTAADTLEASSQLAMAAATELIAYCRALGFPFGINIESVSIRRVEIEASVRLAEQLRGELRA